jgi:single-stranded DNA-binding protein
MIFALCTGSLSRDPERRIAKSGKPFVTTTIRVADGNEGRFVSVVAFSEPIQNELLQLSGGDAVSVQGPLQAGTYVASNGETKISLSIVADKILSLKQKPKQRKEKTSQERAPFNDGLPGWSAQ